MTARRALITGITGQDGTYLSELLAAEGTEVHGLVLPGDQQLSALLELVPDAVIHDGDLSSSLSVRAAVEASRPDEIYHLAAASSVAASWNDPVLTSDLNGTGSVRILDAARRYGQSTGTEPRVLMCSTAEMFGNPSESPQDERTPIDPVSPYGAVKAFAHRMAAVARSQGQFAATVILYNHESPRRPETFVTRKITKAAARIAMGSTTPLELGNMSARRDWGFAGDYVKAMVAAIRHDEPDDFVIATGVSHSIEDFVATAFSAAGITDWQAYVQVDSALFRPSDPADFVGDATKARNKLGWTPEINFAELVDMMVRADLSN
ncbi:MAG: GDP-mannose 4,6-dehydratase [Candidatus Nanopelagicales bacterium]